MELGANDGVAFSNTLWLELRRGWKGLLIEPIEDVVYKAVKNRSPRRNRVVRAACVSFDYPHTSVKMSYGNLMSTAMELETDLPDTLEHIQAATQHIPAAEWGRVEDVPAMTLNSILISAKAPQRMDLLSLDVEGAEIEVLKGIDFNHFRFSWILIECRDLPKMERYLSSFDFTLHSKISPSDFLFCDTR